jgi:hypothetical protein
MNGFTSDGGFAERMLVDAPSFPPVSSNISPEVAFNHRARERKRFHSFRVPGNPYRALERAPIWQHVATRGNSRATHRDGADELRGVRDGPNEPESSCTNLPSTAPRSLHSSIDTRHIGRIRRCADVSVGLQPPAAGGRQVPFVPRSSNLPCATVMATRCNTGNTLQRAGNDLTAEMSTGFVHDKGKEADSSCPTCPQPLPGRSGEWHA